MDAINIQATKRSYSKLLHRLADGLGKLWTSPYTVVGLSYGLLWYLPSKLLGAQPKICLGHNAIQFIDSRGILDRAALTLGNVILYGREAKPWGCGAYGDPCITLGRHEQAHTYQYQLLGPLFIPVYCLSGGCRGPDNNPLEQAAQDYGAGRGAWWPAAYLLKWRVPTPGK